MPGSGVTNAPNNQRRRRITMIVSSMLKLHEVLVIDPKIPING
jgi:hypothetical protein